MAPSQRDPPRKDRRTRARRDSYDDLLAPRTRESPRRSPRRPQQAASSRSETSKTSSNALSEDSLAKLNALNEKLGWDEYDDVQNIRRETIKVTREHRTSNERIAKRERRRRREERDHNHYRDKRKEREVESEHNQGEKEDDRHYKQRRDRRRVVSGPLLEEGGSSVSQRWAKYSRKTPNEDDDDRLRQKRRRLWIALTIFLVILIVAVAVGIAVSRKKTPSTNSSSTTSTSSSNPSNNNLNGVSPSSIPSSAQGTYYDPFTWYDTNDFNVTYTAVTVGGLPIMGLNSTWNDDTQANSYVPSLQNLWLYGTVPVRGMNLGGWLSIEPFITPSLFSSYSAHDNVVDEYTLTSKLGSKAASVLEQHYSTFVTEQTLIDIQAAGFDHVRIPYSYWAVTTYPGDPYVAMISWRYLLRGIEWARRCGLRVNLDLHGLPGSQNGWNHSGRQGPIGWLNGTNGQLNADRSLSIHQQLSTFFAQPRYANIITMYGLVNEPRMVDLNTASVLNWTSSAITTVRASGMPPSTIIVFGDGFMGLPNWKGKLQGYPNILLDVHQYVIFNTAQLALNHSAKLDFACEGWSQQTQQSSNAATGFGNFLCGEWSQADTDCATYLNNVGVGSRWEGTLVTGNATTQVLTPTCPTSPTCSCGGANTAVASYSAAYREWLLYFAEAQMYSFEKGWGWFYWTWQTETAAQWSWQKGLAAGTLPKNANPAAGSRKFACNESIPDFAAMGLSEAY